MSGKKKGGNKGGSSGKAAAAPAARDDGSAASGSAAATSRPAAATTNNASSNTSIPTAKPMSGAPAPASGTAAATAQVNPATPPLAWPSWLASGSEKEALHTVRTVIGSPCGLVDGKSKAASPTAPGSASTTRGDVATPALAGGCHCFAYRLIAAAAGTFFILGRREGGTDGALPPSQRPWTRSLASWYTYAHARPGAPTTPEPPQLRVDPYAGCIAGAYPYPWSHLHPRVGWVHSPPLSHLSHVYAGSPPRNVHLERFSGFSDGLARKVVWWIPRSCAALHAAVGASRGGCTHTHEGRLPFAPCCATWTLRMAQAANDTCPPAVFVDSMPSLVEPASIEDVDIGDASVLCTDVPWAAHTLVSRRWLSAICSMNLHDSSAMPGGNQCKTLYAGYSMCVDASLLWSAAFYWHTFGSCGPYTWDAQFDGIAAALLAQSPSDTAARLQHLIADACGFVRTKLVPPPRGDLEIALPTSADKSAAESAPTSTVHSAPAALSAAPGPETSVSAGSPTNRGSAGPPPAGEEGLGTTEVDATTYAIAHREPCAYCSKRPGPHEPAHGRCAACWSVAYCSVSCQSRDWKRRHRHQCRGKAAEAAAAAATPGASTSAPPSGDVAQ